MERLFCAAVVAQCSFGKRDKVTEMKEKVFTRQTSNNHHVGSIYTTNSFISSQLERVRLMLWIKLRIVSLTPLTLHFVKFTLVLLTKFRLE
jgi:hypothetical protein